MTRAIVLFAHGARDPRWAEPFEAVAARVRAAAPDYPVALAFLELMAPTLDAAVAGLVGAGATRIDVVPLFLGTGGHLRRDLPPLVDGVSSLPHAATAKASAPAASAAARLEFLIVSPPQEFSESPSAGF